jgi:hypothetical protein
VASTQHTRDVVRRNGTEQLDACVQIKTLSHLFNGSSKAKRKGERKMKKELMRERKREEQKEKRERERERSTRAQIEMLSHLFNDTADRKTTRTRQTTEVNQSSCAYELFFDLRLHNSRT